MDSKQDVALAIVGHIDLAILLDTREKCFVQALNNSELLARSRELQLVELAVGHYLRFADQCAHQLDTESI
jgi:hypothetical protein